MTDERGRYVCYGVPKAEEHEAGNPGMQANEQRVAAEEVVYSTDDREEALAIKRNGGFVGDSAANDGAGSWTVVTRVVDSEDSMPAPARREPLGKHNTDQT